MKQLYLPITISLFVMFGLLPLNYSHGSDLKAIDESLSSQIEGLRNDLNISLDDQCEEFEYYRVKNGTEWKKETHLALSEGRDPTYLPYLYCNISKNINKRLMERRSTIDNHDELIKHNIYAFYSAHNYYSFAFKKIHTITKEVIKSRTNVNADLNSLSIFNFNFLKLSKSVLGKLNNYVLPKLLPQELMLIKCQALDAYLEKTLNSIVENEARTKYRHNDNIPFVTEAVYRIAEREVLKKFSEEALLNEIIDISYDSVKERTRIENFFDISNPKFFNYINRKIKETYNRFDMNITLFLLQLQSINPNTSVNFN